MCLDDTAADRKTHTHARIFCRIEGLESSLMIRKSRAGVVHGESNVIGICNLGRHRNCTLQIGALGQCIERISDEIGQYLLDLNMIALD